MSEVKAYLESLDMSVLPANVADKISMIIKDDAVYDYPADGEEFKQFKSMLESKYPNAVPGLAAKDGAEPTMEQIREFMDTLQILADSGNTDAGELLDSLKIVYGKEMAKGGAMGLKVSDLKKGDLLKRKGSALEVAVLEIGNEWQSGNDYALIETPFGSPKKYIDVSEFVLSDGSPKPQYAKGGVLEVKDGEDTFYLTYIDSTHFYLSNSPDFKGSAYHIGQFRGRPFYNQIDEWLKSHKGMYANGGAMGGFYAVTKFHTGETKLVPIKKVSFYHNRKFEHEPTMRNLESFFSQVPFDEMVCIYDNERESDGELHSAHTPLFTSGAKKVHGIVDESGKAVKFESFDFYARGGRVGKKGTKSAFGLLDFEALESIFNTTLFGLDEDETEETLDELRAEWNALSEKERIEILNEYVGSEWKEQYARGGKLSKYRYVPNRNVESVELTKGKKTIDVDGAHVLDGVYVRKDKYAKGGDVEMVDLFEDYDNIPSNIQVILDKYSDAFTDGDYNGLSKALKEVEAKGYTFEFDLGGEAFGLRPKNVPLNKLKGYEDSGDKYAKGGAMAEGESYEYVNTFGIDDADFQNMVDAYHNAELPDTSLTDKYGEETISRASAYIHATHQSNIKK